ncbi:hypothetical protein Q4511_09220 [Paracoccus sp. 1_MG-2023]|uniref:hypothetical protein n=1 Tax=unclassified Paracoccus (in: a-proteobacteria) TaxID=2688777 RepID=UPI001C092CA3|nr:MULTISPECIES: hypothetical protein [unclassified Paracoccus (in: a-proteobacteria)]MBU2957215.1 hypothetical protein [Paracoccus sp. C2R09]MDO6669102.1 hypothetical protein [Paracoccus sp. 1_MG-2023]
MKRIANNIACAAAATGVALLSALPAAAAPQPGAPVEGWSAMRGVQPAAMLDHIDAMPLSEDAVADQPYCASDAEIQNTLTHDFSEELVVTAGFAATELWGSEQMGTWTLVAARADETSCIIASGTGFSDQRTPDVYFQTAGL